MVSVAVLSRGLLVAVLFLGFLPTVLSMTHMSCYILVVLKDGRRRHAQQRYSSGAAGGSEPVLVLIYASRPLSAQHDVVKKIAATRPGTVQTWSLHYMYSIRGTEGTELGILKALNRGALEPRQSISRDDTSRSCAFVASCGLQHVHVLPGCNGCGSAGAVLGKQSGARHAGVDKQPPMKQPGCLWSLQRSRGQVSARQYPIPITQQKPVHRSRRRHRSRWRRRRCEGAKGRGRGGRVVSFGRGAIGGARQLGERHERRRGGVRHSGACGCTPHALTRRRGRCGCLPRAPCATARRACRRARSVGTGP